MKRPGAGAIEEPAIWKALAEVRDPEFPLSIVDLGLVYGVKVEGEAVAVTMTLTSMGCPCHQWIVEDVEERLRRVPGVGTVSVEVVWHPPWTRSRITPAGRRALAGWGVEA